MTVVIRCGAASCAMEEVVPYKVGRCCVTGGEEGALGLNTCRSHPGFRGEGTDR
jgi:hypothetical protein